MPMRRATMLCLALAALPLPALAAEPCGVVTSGAITLSAPWSRATVGEGRPGVLYVTIANAGPEADSLIAVASPMAGMAMLHKTTVTDGVASMDHAMAVAIPAGEGVAFAPGGYHVMLMDLTSALKVGDALAATLTFEAAGDIAISAPVLALGAEGPDCTPPG